MIIFIVNITYNQIHDRESIMRAYIEYFVVSEGKMIHFSSHRSGKGSHFVLYVIHRSSWTYRSHYLL